MPLLVTPNTFTNNVSTVDATTMNANFAQVVTIVNGLDNANVGILGFYASQIKPTSGAQATFGTGQNYTFPQAVVAKGGVATTNGFQTDTAVNMGFYSGTGVPSFSAPNGTLYIRYDGGATAVVYVNTSGASTSGTTWSTVAVGGAAAQIAETAFTYSLTGTETDASPATMATQAITLGTSPLTNWRVIAQGYFTSQDAMTTTFGIGSTTAGTATAPLYAAPGTSAHQITGGNIQSDATYSSTIVAVGDMVSVQYSATYANAAAPSFKLLIGAQNGTNTHKVVGVLRVLAFAQ